MTDDVRHLEQTQDWPEIKKALETRDIQTVSEDFGVAPAAIRGAMRRQLKASRMRMVRLDPPDPAPPTKAASKPKAKKKATKKAAAPTEKQQKLNGIRHLLGTRPDGELATEIGLSMWVVRGFRLREGVEAYSRWKTPASPAAAPAADPTPQPPAAKATPDAPRRRGRKRGAGGDRLVELKELMGVVPDRVLAQVTGLHVNTVRIQRRKFGIAGAPRGRPGAAVQKRIEALLAQFDAPSPASPAPEASSAAEAAPPPAPAPAPVAAPRAAPAPRATSPSPTTTTYAWRVVCGEGDTELSGIVVGATLSEVATALARRNRGDVRHIERLDAVL